MLALLAVDCKIVCCTTHFNYEQLYDLQDHKNVSWYLKKEKEGNEVFFDELSEKLQSCDAVIVTTQDNDLTFFSGYKFPTKSFLVIHNYHAILEPSRNFYLAHSPIKNSLKIARYFLLNLGAKTRKMLVNYDGLILPNEIIYNYVKSRTRARGYDFKIADFCVYEGNQRRTKENEVNIIVPGTISNKTRDYSLLVRLMKRTVPHLKKKCKLTLLGKPRGSYGNHIINGLSELENDYFSLQYYTDFVGQKEFDLYMKKADFLILPIDRYMKYDIFKEVMSQSSVSGSIADMVRYGLPAILPSYYQLNDSLEGMVGRYDDLTSLSDIFLHWVNDEVYKVKTTHIEKALKPFAPEKIGESILDQLFEL